MIYNLTTRKFTAEECDFPSSESSAKSELTDKYLGKDVVSYPFYTMKPGMDMLAFRAGQNIIESLSSLKTQLEEYATGAAKFNAVKGNVLSLRLGQFSWQTVASEAVSAVEGTSDATKAKLDPVAFTSTRKMLIALGRPKYDGPEFKFVSHDHKHPKQKDIYTLATKYLMTVIIPNALLAKQHGALIDFDTVCRALKHCMTVGKSLQCASYWTTFVAEQPPELTKMLDIVRYYVFDTKSDGSKVEPNRRWFFKKFVDKKCKDQKSFRKGKLSDELQKLLKRAETEPELKTMCKRELVEKGISQRLALMFIQARNG